MDDDQASKIWELWVPHFNPPNNEPGWYFLFENRDEELRAAGPYPSKEYCLRVIATRRPCHNCGAPCIHDEFDDPAHELAMNAAGYVTLCQECNTEFIAWHTKKHGHPPVPGGVQ